MGSETITLSPDYMYFGLRVSTVKEKYLENEIFSRSEKSQGLLWMAREI